MGDSLQQYTLRGGSSAASLKLSPPRVCWTMPAMSNDPVPPKGPCSGEKVLPQRHSTVKALENIGHSFWCSLCPDTLTQKPWAYHERLLRAGSKYQQVPRPALSTHAVWDSWILGSSPVVLALFGDPHPSPLSLPPVWHFSTIAFACSLGQFSLSAFTQVLHTGPEDSATLTKAKG